MKKLAASKDKMSITKCGNSHIPNNQTLKAIKSAEKGKDLIHYNSLEDILKS
ncbi:MAG TPA: hypothetical protein VLG44_07040 [Chlamydiales bacterium]|nr:hypothetical protein [Chlamydiales bacterium]